MGTASMETAFARKASLGKIAVNHNNANSTAITMENASEENVIAMLAMKVYSVKHCLPVLMSVQTTEESAIMVNVNVHLAMKGYGVNSKCNV
jgi:hypothetical protein